MNRRVAIVAGILAIAGGGLAYAQDTYSSLTSPVSAADIAAIASAASQAAQDAADAKAQAAAAASSASGAVKTVNGVAPTSGNVAVAVPTPANTTPPGVADSGTIGTMTTMYALANHTHASKARKGRVLIPATQVLDVTFTTPFTSSPPICAVVAETASGDTNVVNAQIDGTPTMTGLRIRITRTAVSFVSLLGINLLSVPTQTATQAHYVCLEP